MKKIFVLLCSASLLFSCEEKSKPVNPELSAQVAGDYKVTRLEVDGTNIPLSSASIELEIVRFSAEVVTGKMMVEIEGEAEPDEDLGTLTLKSAGSAGIDIYEGTDKVGNLDKSNKLSIYVQYEGQNFEMIAEKR